MFVAETDPDVKILKALVDASEEESIEHYEMGNMEITTDPPQLGTSDIRLGIKSRPGLLYVTFGR